MKKIITIASLALTMSSAFAQTWVTIPDANFVTYLQSIIPAAMSGNQMDITNTLVTTSTTTLNVQSRSIANLSGVQYFTSLTTLYCSSNSLTTLPALPNSLQTLNCNSNSLTTLPALPTSLTYLDCGWNNLTNLPALSGLLTFLNCSDNTLTSLPALLNSLQTLFCATNALTSLPTLPNSLIDLECEYNALTTLPALPNSLTGLVCFHNNITCFQTFSNSINNLQIDPNPYNCLPNYIMAMGSTTTPLCAAGNSNGCAVTTGIEQYANSNEVSVYPNPASSSLQVTFAGNIQNTTLLITDMLGNTVKQATIKTAKTSINVSDLAEGVYNISISTNAGVVNKRVVIVR